MPMPNYTRRVWVTIVVTYINASRETSIRTSTWLYTFGGGMTWEKWQNNFQKFLEEAMQKAAEDVKSLGAQSFVVSHSVCPAEDSR